MVPDADLAQEQSMNVNQKILQISEIDEVGKMSDDLDEPESLKRAVDLRCDRKISHRPRKRSPKMLPTQASEYRVDPTEVETRVKKLMEDLKSASPEAVREAASEIRLLSKEMGNRICIASCGSISPLVDLLRSSDSMTQEYAVTSLLNLSINDNNKISITTAKAIEPLIHVLKTGTPEAKENSAATLYSLATYKENKIHICKSGAITPLVELLENGTPRGKKDAANALFYLSTCNENRADIVRSGAVQTLIDLMDPATGMVDRAVVILANLAGIQEGRSAIAQAGGIPLLVEAVELGSPRGRENATASLVHLCTNSNRYSRMVLEQGVVPPLVALSKSGTPRAKEKALKLLDHLKGIQRNYARRG